MIESKIVVDKVRIKEKINHKIRVTPRDNQIEVAIPNTLRTPYASLALSGATHASSLYCTTVLTPITYPLAAADRARIVAVLLRKAYSPAALGRSPHVRAASYIYVCYSSRCMGYMLIRLEEDKVEGTSASVESGKHNITV
jgi:hypothetical protein